MADLPVRRGSGSGVSRREWDPFQRMQELMGFDPLETMGQLLGGRELAGAAGYLPAFDVKETKDAFIFKADLPGVEEKDIEITLTGDRLVVSGKRMSATSPTSAASAPSAGPSPCPRAWMARTSRPTSRAAC